MMGPLTESTAMTASVSGAIGCLAVVAAGAIIPGDFMKRRGCGGKTIA